MLLSEHSAGPHCCGWSVNHRLGKGTGIFMGDNAGDGPGHGRMVGRKRSAILKKVAKPLALVRALPSKCTDRKSTRLNSSHQITSYSVFCLKKENRPDTYTR